MDSKIDAIREALRARMPSEKSSSGARMILIEALLDDIEQAARRGVSYSDMIKVIEAHSGLKISITTMRSYVSEARKKRRKPDGEVK